MRQTTMKRTSKRYIETKWEIRTYDVWGNAKDGFEVNDVFRSGTIDLRIPVTTNNAGTNAAFDSASPTDGQIRKALGCERVHIDTDGDDVNITVDRARDGYPLGELYCISHESLSPIREVAAYDVIVGNIGKVYSGIYEHDARMHFNNYVEQSTSGHGRASGESVTLMRNGEIVREHNATISTEAE